MFYQNMTNSILQIDYIFSSRAEMDEDFGSNTKGIYLNRYVLVSYGDTKSQDYYTNLERDKKKYTGKNIDLYSNFNDTVWMRTKDNYVRVGDFDQTGNGYSIISKDNTNLKPVNPESKLELKTDSWINVTLQPNNQTSSTENDKIKIEHKQPQTASKTVGDNSSKTSSYEGTEIKIPKIGVDARGHISSASDTTIKITETRPYVISVDILQSAWNSEARSVEVDLKEYIPNNLTLDDYLVQVSNNSTSIVDLAYFQIGVNASSKNKTSLVFTYQSENRDQNINAPDKKISLLITLQPQLEIQNKTITKN